jgi:hypothetical protein
MESRIRISEIVRWFLIPFKRSRRMKKSVISLVAAIILVAGIAYGQAVLPMRVSQAHRIVVKVDADQWKDVSVQADSAIFEKGEMRLVGRVRIGLEGHVMTADTATIGANLVTLIGNARVQRPTGQ